MLFPEASSVLQPYRFSRREVWCTLKKMCMYAVQFGDHHGFLITGTELLCFGFRAVVPPGVRDCHLCTSTPLQVQVQGNLQM